MAATGYRFGYEMLMINGLLTFLGLWMSSFGAKPEASVHADGDKVGKW
ncbi:hypothetical protein SAMN05216383_1233 [Prevotella sp. KH2C16]|nr:hypothetical protein SAMN05216383_1233 [Prevotella sp. KH2C16]